MASLSYLTADVWRYENAGTADGLTTSGTTLTNLPATRSKTGTAFYQTTRAKCFNLPATTDIWIKFDVYYNGTQRWRAYNGVGGITAWNRSNTVANALGFFDTNGTQVHYVTGVCKPNTLQTVLLHMQAGTTDGIIETWVDDVFIYRYTGNVNGGNAFADVFLQSDGSGTFFSSVTISNSQRGLVIREQVSADTRRIVVRKETARADTFRQVVKTETVVADLLRRLREVSRADTCRHVKRTERAVARTVIRVPHVLNYVLQSRPQTFKAASTRRRLANDNPLSLVNTFKDYGVTAINITLSERTLSDDFRFDIASRSMDINETVQGWLLDYPFHFLVEETTQTDLVQSVKGRYSVDDLLYTQFFIATVKVESDDGNTIEIPGGRYVKYSYGDATYLYPQAAEIITDVAHYFGVTPDVKIDDFTPYNLSGDHRITYADLLNSVFGWTSRLPQRQINVFIRGSVLHCIQRGKEDSVFDITDLPHSRPTINKKLIRSLWSNPKADDAATSSGSSSSGSSENSPIVDYQYEEFQEPFSGTISFEDEGVSTTWVYKTGLLMREHSHTSNAKATLDSSVTYTYEEIFPADMSTISISLKKSLEKNFYGDFYISMKKLKSSATTVEKDEKGKKDYTRVKQYGDTSYRYARTEGGDIYLNSEVEDTETITYETNDKGYWEETDREENIRETFHVPIGNGWYGQSVYLNGAAQGSNISQGAPGNKVSQYMRSEVQKSLKGYTITYTKPSADDSTESGDGTGGETAESYDDWRRKLAPIADVSFPVRELDLLKTLTNALLWLNRKVQETISVDLVAKVDNGVPSIQHIVDFTERIRLDGAEYFLVSNRISFTPRKLIQKLQLIRWY